MAQEVSTTLYVLKEGNQLSTVQLNNLDAISEPVDIDGFFDDHELVALDVRPQNQQLYALGVKTGTNTVQLFYITHTPSGTHAIPVGQPQQLSNGETTIPITDTVWDMDFDPASDQLRIVNADQLNFRMNPNFGTLIDGREYSGDNPDDSISALSGSPEVSGIAYTNNQPNGTNGGTLYSLDTDASTLNIQEQNANDPASSGNQILPLPVQVDAEILAFTGVTGFDLPPGVNVDSLNEPVSDGVGYAVLTTESTSRLYRLILGTNLIEAESLGDLTAVSIAIRTTLGTAIGLSADRLNLVRFNPFGGSFAFTPVPISGIASGETLVALELHPLTGKLFGLGINSDADTGTLYSVDPQTGDISSDLHPGVIAFKDGEGNAVDFPAANAGWSMGFQPTTGEIRITCGSFTGRFDDFGQPLDGNYGGESDSILNTNPDALINLDSSEANVLGISYTMAYEPDSQAVSTLYALSAESNSLYVMDSGSNNNLSSLTNGVTLVNEGEEFQVSNITAFAILDHRGEAFVSASGFFLFDVLFRLDLATGEMTPVSIAPSLTGMVVMSAAEAPTVALTADASNVTTTGATLSGKVTEEGGASVSERGFIFLPSSSEAPLVLDGDGVTPVMDDDLSVAITTFDLDVGDLAPGTSYIYRAYARNSAGVGYSEIRVFTTINDFDIEFAEVAVGGEYQYEVPMAEGSTVTARGLPPGLRLNSRTGIITGRASTPGVYQVVVTVKGPDNVKTTTIETFNVQALPTTAVGTFVAYVDRPEESSVTSGLGRLDVKTTAKGSFTVKLTRASRALSGKGFLESNLVDAPILKTTLSDGTQIELSLRDENTVEGGVFVGETAANVVGWRKTYDRLLAPATEQMGYYTVYMQTETGDLDFDSVPQGHGYAAVTIGLDGSYKLVGKAADGSPVTTAAFLGSNGQMMVFTSLYKKQGSISAFLVIETNDAGNYADNLIHGTLYLNKPATPGRAYPAAFPHLQLSVQGMYMARAATGGIVLGLPSTTEVSSLAFRDGGIGSSALDPSLYGSVNFSAATQKATVPPLGSSVNPARTTLTLKASNGSLTGSFKLVDGPLKRTVKYQGLLVRTGSDTIGRGYFLLPQIPDSSQTVRNSPVLSGRVELVDGGLESF